MMKSKYMWLIISLLPTFSGFAQENQEKGFFKKFPFVNMTEIGVLMGKNKMEGSWWGIRPQTYVPYYYMQNRVSPTIQTFNGVYVSPKTAVGITTGIDVHGNTMLMPIAGGIRQRLLQKKQGGSALVASLDAGYSTTWLNEDATNYKTTGGVMINPMLGYRLPMRNGSAWLLNFGYKYQYATYEQLPSENDYMIQSIERRNYRRLSFRFGVEF